MEQRNYKALFEAIEASRRQSPGRREAILKCNCKIDVVTLYFQLKAKYSHKSDTALCKMISEEMDLKKEIKISYKTILKFLRTTYNIDGNKAFDSLPTK